MRIIMSLKSLVNSPIDEELKLGSWIEKSLSIPLTSTPHHKNDCRLYVTQYDRKNVVPSILTRLDILDFLPLRICETISDRKGIRRSGGIPWNGQLHGRGYWESDIQAGISRLNGVLCLMYHGQQRVCWVNNLFDFHRISCSIPSPAMLIGVQDILYDNTSSRGTKIEKMRMRMKVNEMDWIALKNETNETKTIDTRRHETKRREEERKKTRREIQC
jgi:hypothetical protein